jgi:hypothetical protein
MSPPRKTALPPSALISSITDAPELLEDVDATTLAPSLARRRAATSPMPRAEPVTMTVLPSNDRE